MPLDAINGQPLHYPLPSAGMKRMTAAV